MADYKIRILTETNDAQAGLGEAKRATEEVGNAASSMAQRWSAAAPLIGTAIGLVIAKMQEWDAIVKNNEARLDVFRNLNKEVERFGDNIQKATLEAEKFGRSIDAALGKQDTPKEEADQEAEAIKRKFAATKTREGFGKELAIATIDRRVAAGEITKEEGARQKAEVGLQFQQRQAQLGIQEKGELTLLAERTVFRESDRLAELQGQIPGARAAALAASENVSDKKRAFEAALKFAGLDKELQPTKGGRIAEIDELLASKSAGGLFKNDLTARRELETERASLRAGAVIQKNILGIAESDSAAAQDKLRGLESDALGSARGLRGLGRAAKSSLAEYDAAAGLEQAVAPVRALAETEKAKAEDFKEAARQQAKAAKLLKETLRSLGKAVDEVRGAKAAADDLRSRTRSNLQSE